MAHSLLEKEWILTRNRSYDVDEFLTQAIGLTASITDVVNYNYCPNGSGISFFAVIKQGSVGNGETALSIIPKRNDQIINKLYNNTIAGTMAYHISSNESTKYFKHISSNNELGNNYTYVLAQDINDEWVIFNGDKMYSNYGETGIYANPQDGSHSSIVSDGNLFMISEAYRYDTGVKFKDLFFVLSATSYSDRNCIIEKDGVKYRLVSVSNHTDAQGRYPSFAFPVSN